MAEGRTGFSAEEARWVGEQIAIDWASAPFEVDAVFRQTPRTVMVAERWPDRVR